MPWLVPISTPRSAPGRVGRTNLRSDALLDFYLASLAQKHGMQLATLDEGIKHQAAFVIPA